MRYMAESNGPLAPGSEADEATSRVPTSVRSLIWRAFAVGYGTVTLADATWPNVPVEGTNVAAYTVPGAVDEPRVAQTAMVVDPERVNASPSTPLVPFGTVNVRSTTTLEPLIEKIVPAPVLVSVAHRPATPGTDRQRLQIGRRCRPGHASGSTWPDVLSFEIRFWPSLLLSRAISHPVGPGRQPADPSRAPRAELLPGRS